VTYGLSFFNDLNPDKDKPPVAKTKERDGSPPHIGSPWRPSAKGKSGLKREIIYQGALEHEVSCDMRTKSLRRNNHATEISDTGDCLLLNAFSDVKHPDGECSILRGRSTKTQGCGGCP